MNSVASSLKHHAIVTALSGTNRLTDGRHSISSLIVRPSRVSPLLNSRIRAPRRQRALFTENPFRR